MRAKSESGFEDVSSLIFIDFGPLLVSILGPKIDKTELQIKRILEAILDSNKKGAAGNRNDGWDPERRERGWPDGMREAAGGLNSLTESDKS